MPHATVRPRRVFVVSVSHIPKDGRVLRQIRCLKDGGWIVTAIGLNPSTGTAIDRIEIDGVRHVMVAPQSWTRRTRLLAGVDLLTGRAVPGASAALARARRLPSVQAIVTELLAEIQQSDADGSALVVANDWMALPAALEAHRRHGIPFHYDTHEFAIAEHQPNPLWQLTFSPMIARIERAAISKSRSTSTVSQGIASSLRDSYGMSRMPTVIRNVPDREPLPPRPVSTPSQVLYHGLFKPDRGLLELIQSVPMWPERYRLTLRGWSPNTSFDRELRQACVASSAAACIKISPAVDLESVVTAAHAADIGVFLPSLSSPQNRFAMPNKLFEYLHAGLMVIVPAGTDMGDLVQQTGTGLALDDPSPHGLAKALTSLTPGQITNFKSAAHNAAKVLTWDHESLRLRAALGAAE